jgi:hypothetical protein
LASVISSSRPRAPRYAPSGPEASARPRRQDRGPTALLPEVAAGEDVDGGTSGIRPKSPRRPFPAPDRSGRSVSRSITSGRPRSDAASRPGTADLLHHFRTYPAGMHSGVAKAQDRGAEDQGTRPRASTPMPPGGERGTQVGGA